MSSFAKMLYKFNLFDQPFVQEPKAGGTLEECWKRSAEGYIVQPPLPVSHKILLEVIKKETPTFRLGLPSV